MPRIFDNIHIRLLPDLQQAIRAAYRADFCVGYFNLRGWKEIADEIDSWPGGDGHCVRLRAELDGMIANLYGLTESEFAHILATFPLVKDEVKAGAMDEFGRVEKKKY